VGCNFHILEIIAEWLVGLPMEPVFYFQAMRAGTLVILFSIYNKYKCWREMFMRGDDLILYGCKHRKPSPHTFMIVNKTTMKYVC